MPDPPSTPDPVEQRLGLVARGVQRMADAFGSLERRLNDVADKEGLQALSDRIDEYRVRGRSEVAQIAERIERLEAALATAARDAAGRGDDGELVEVVRGMGDDLAVAIAELRAETANAVERVVADQGTRLARLHEVLGQVRDRPAPPALDDLQATLTEIRDELRGVHGEIVSVGSQLRTDLAADAADQRDRLVEVLSSVPVGDERFAAIEQAVAALRDDVAIERLETSMRTISEDTSGLRSDVRRSFERVLLSIDNVEQSVVGEVRAIDHRLGGMADDLRLVRSMRDGLEALSSGVDAVRQLAARGATSTQMVDLTRDLTHVLAEIETARAQVLAVDQHVGLAHAGTIDVGVEADVRREVEDLERTVSEGITDLGRRIEALASTSAPQTGVDEDPLVRRLRSLATSARQLGMGMAEDLRSRRRRSRPLRASRES